MPLTVEDFRNPLFDSQRVVRRKIPARPGIEPAWDEHDEEAFEAGGNPDVREIVIEGATFTDEFVRVGFTYYVTDGMLSVKNEKNQELFRGVIATREDFEKALKKADKKQKTLR